MKCESCNKKMGVMSFTCKCEKQVCLYCRIPEIHHCTFDYKSEQKIKLTEKLQKIIAPRIIPI